VKNVTSSQEDVMLSAWLDGGGCWWWGVYVCVCLLSGALVQPAQWALACPLIVH
jgi:hypothetical protein